MVELELRVSLGAVSLAQWTVRLKEDAPLRELVANEGEIVVREDLYARLWGKPMSHHRDRSVDVYVRKVRAKLAELDPDVAFIHTHFGYGYRFEPTREA